MDKFGISQSAARLEDVRFLTGAGRYVDDIAPEGALYGAVLRSMVAHGTITELDTAAAAEMPGVALVLTAEDLVAAGIRMDLQATIIANRDGSRAASPTRPILAQGRVRFVGEPVAMVFAETPAQAKDAVEAIVLDIDDLPAKLDIGPGGEAVHDEAPDNVAFDWACGDEAATEAAFARAAHRVGLVVEDNRIICNSMEPRGCYAEIEQGRLHFAHSGQGVWTMKGQLCRNFGLSPEEVRVTNPDVGGGFGMKTMAYPEYFVVAHAARLLERPCRWVAERGEGMLSDNAGRDLASDVELAFDENLKLIGFRADVLCNLGAYNSQFAQAIQTNLAMKVMTGVYDVQHAHMRVRGIYTNTTQVDAYRGAGRPEAIYTLERAMDHAARSLGITPWGLRKRSFISEDQMPYAAPSGETYDVGAFARVLDRAAVEADRDGFAARRADSALRGKLRGQGLCYYIEAILGDPSEGAKMVFEEDGTVALYVGTQSNGQGHETVFVQVLHEMTGIPPERIRIVQGDSDLIAKGGGTGGSRSVTVQSQATRAMVDTAIAAFAPFLADRMGVEAGEVTFEDGSFRAEGSNVVMTMIEAAEAARAAGETALLTHEAQATLPGRSFPNGAHVCEVEIDPDTGVVAVDRYTVVDDFGVLINPRLAEGQVHGGVAQGIGQALTEHVVYDADGQLLTASFMDYGMPRADDVPMIAFHTEPVPSKNNVLGMKGCGEAGTVGALAAVANAVQDAVWDLGLRKVDMPFTPARMWEMLNTRAHAAE